MENSRHESTCCLANGNHDWSRHFCVASWASLYISSQVARTLELATFFFSLGDVHVITHFSFGFLESSFMMAFRNPFSQLTKRASPSTVSRLTSAPAPTLWQRPSADQLRNFATPVPPVTQDATSSKGPTAMVFMNMGGPSTTGEVGDFLSRLFVHPRPRLS